MIFSYIYIVSILTFVIVAQADISQTFNSKEFSLPLSNEQVTQYKYKRSTQTATTKKNANYSITTNINTNITQETHSTNELDLKDLDSTNLNSELNVDLIDKLNGKYFDSNGNELSYDNFQNIKKTSNYYGDNQYTADLKKGISTAATSSPDSNGSPSSAIPTSPNGDSTSVLRADANINGKLSSPIIPNYLQTSNPNTDNGAYKSNLNGGTPTTAASSSDSNGSPSSAIPTSPNGDSTSILGGDANINGKLSSPIIPNYLQTSNPNNDNGAYKSNLNGGTPTTVASSSGSNGYPSSASPTSPNAYSTDKLNGKDFDSNRNEFSYDNFKNIQQTSNYYRDSQNTAVQGGSYPYPPLMNDDLNNQVIQKSLSTFNVQKTAPLDQFSSSLVIPPTLTDENINDLLSGGDIEFNTQPNLNGLPQTVDQSPTVNEYSSMMSETYGSLNYNMGYELQNSVSGMILNDGQLSMNDIPITHNYGDTNDGVVNSLSNGNGVAYNDYFYGSYVNTERSSDGDFGAQNDDDIGTQNDGYIVDDYFENIDYDNTNLQESPYDSSVSNLNARYDNSEQLYILNQNDQSFKSSAFPGNVIMPYGTDIYLNPQMPITNADLYNNIYDQTDIRTDELSPENNKLSRTDFRTFSNTPISQPTDNFLDLDLTSDRVVYDLDYGNNIDIKTGDSNFVGQANENNLFDAQSFNELNMQSINIPKYNQLIGDYPSSLNTETNADIDVLKEAYLTTQPLNSEYNFFTGGDLNKQSSNLNKQNSDSNNLPIDNVQLNRYLYHKTDTSNVNNLIGGSANDNSNDSPIKAFDNRLKSIQTTVSNKNNALVGQNVFDSKGQVIGKIYKPSNGIVRRKYSDSSSYSSSSDSRFFDDMDVIENDIKRATRDALSNVLNNTKDAYDTAKAFGKTVGNITKNAIGNVLNNTKDAYRTAKAFGKTVGNIAKNATRKAADGVKQAAKTAYHGAKDSVKAVENAVSDATDNIEITAENF